MTIKALWPKKGDRLLIALEQDSKDRLWGIIADEPVFRSISRTPGEELKNKDVTGTVFRLKLVGTFILTDDHYIRIHSPIRAGD